MGFQKPDLTNARQVIGRCIVEISSPYNDGWTSSNCKKDLYMLKCWLDDQYEQLPKFVDEKEWDKERVVQKLKQR